MKILQKKKYLNEILKVFSPDKALYWIALEELADCFCEEKNYKKSISLFTSMIEQNEQGSVFQLLGYYGRAWSYYEMEEYDKTLENYTAIIEYGSWINEKHKFDDIYDSVIPFHIFPMEVYEKRALLFRYEIPFKENITKENEFELKAIAEYSKAIDIAKKMPKNARHLAGYYFHRSVLYKEIKEFDKTIEDCSAIIALGKEAGDLLEYAIEEQKMLCLKKGDKGNEF